MVVVGESTGVQLDTGCPNFCCGFNLVGFRVNEETRLNTGCVHVVGDFSDTVDLSSGIKSAFSCDFLAILGNQAHALGLYLKCKTAHLIGAGHFKIEAGGNIFLNLVDVVCLDVTCIFAEMCRDTICPSFFTQEGKLDQVRLNIWEIIWAEMTVAGLAERCAVVDVYAE
jgi:hypothetical protein